MAADLGSALLGDPTAEGLTVLAPTEVGMLI